MSNRGRQNVASFLTKDLQVDWRVGAEFFEAHLIDHEVRKSLRWRRIYGVLTCLAAICQLRKLGLWYADLGVCCQYVSEWAICYSCGSWKRSASLAAVQPDQAGQRRACFADGLTTSADYVPYSTILKGITSRPGFRS